MSRTTRIQDERAPPGSAGWRAVGSKAPVNRRGSRRCPLPLRRPVGRGRNIDSGVEVSFLGGSDRERVPPPGSGVPASSGRRAGAAGGRRACRKAARLGSRACDAVRGAARRTASIPGRRTPRDRREKWRGQSECRMLSGTCRPPQVAHVAGTCCRTVQGIWAGLVPCAPYTRRGRLACGRAVCVASFSQASPKLRKSKKVLRSR